MITEVYVRNFRGIAEETVTLGKLTVLVGRNGAGKSAFVDALRFVRDALTLSLSDAVIDARGGFNALRRWSPEGGAEVKIGLKLGIPNEFTASYCLCLTEGEGGLPSISSERGEIELLGVADQGDGWGRDGFERQGKQLLTLPARLRTSKTGGTVEARLLALPAFASVSPSLFMLEELLKAMDFSAVFPPPLRGLQKASTPGRLADDGSNLASVLDRLLNKGEYGLDLKAALKHIAPDVLDVRVTPVGSYLLTELQHDMGEGHTAWFELAQESDGTLRALGVLTALYRDARPSRSAAAAPFLAIEEPELMLHPGALDIMAAVLRKTSARRQLLLTTQSPDLIAHFGADELRIVERRDGITRIGPLADHQRETINEELFSGGDLLRIESLYRQPVGEEEPAWIVADT